MSNSGDDFTKKVIEKFRVQLLDLSKRNNLISFKHTNKSTKQIRVIDEVITNLFDKLVSDEELGFKSVPLPDNIPEDEKNETFEQKLKELRLTDEEFHSKKNALGQEPSEREYLQLDIWLRDKARKILEMKPINRTQTITIEEQAKKFGVEPNFDLQLKGKQKKHTDNYIQTLLYPDQLERRLKSTHEQCKLYENEAGINILYMAFGYLEWYETDTSTGKITTPLILVPINIKRELKKGEYQYQIALRDDDISHNLCLEEKLKREFGLVLPKFENDLVAYFETISELVKNKSEWRVKNYATIGFFAFSKISMYKDLDPVNWNDTKLNEESLVYSLINGKDKSDILFAEDYEIDKKKLNVEIPLTITDADSSQLSAIFDVLQGKDLVIEGPPGTGKSQTITNIIAAALEKNKKVLFISEKKAALEVVKNRLDKSGLGVFCLELHSSKTKRSDVAKSISDNLELRSKRKTSPNIQQEIYEIEKTKKQIENYINCIHAIYSPLNLTFQNIIWKYLKTSSQLSISAKKLDTTRIENFESIDDNKLQNIKFELKKFVQYANESETGPEGYFTHAWRPITTGKVTAQNSQEFLNQISTIIKSLSNFHEEYGATGIFGSEVNNLTIEEAIKTQEFLEQNKSIGSTPINFNIFIKLTDSSILKELEDYLENEDQIESLNSKLLRQCQTPELEKVFSLTSLFISEQDILLTKDIALNKVTTEISSVEVKLNKVQESIEVLSRALEAINIAPPKNKKELDEIREFINDIRNLPDFVLIHKNQTLCSFNAKNQVEELKSNNLKLIDLKKSLKNSFLDKTFDLQQEDIFGILNEFKHYSLFSWFKSSFRKARRLYKTLYTGNNLNRNYIVSNLELLYNFVNDYSKHLNSPSYKLIIGAPTKGLDIPLEEIEVTVNKINEIKYKYPEHDPYSSSLQKIITEKDNQTLEKCKRLLSHSSVIESIDYLISELKSEALKDTASLTSKFDSKKERLTRYTNLETRFNLKGELKLSEVLDLQNLLNNFSVRLNTRKTYQVSLEYLISGVSNKLIRETIKISNLINNSKIPRSLKTFIYNQRNQDSIKLIFDILPNLKNVTTRAHNEVISLYTRWGLSCSSLFGKEDYSQICINLLAESFKSLIIKKYLLVPYLQLKETEDALVSSGLKAFLRDLTHEKIAFELIDEMFIFSLYNTILNDFFNKNFELKKNMGISLGELRNLFKQQDKKLIELQRQQLNIQLLKSSTVEGNSKGKVKEYTEMGFLHHQISLQKGHAPVREYFLRAPASTLAIKPCLMMSPLSLSQYLPNENFTFDLVVMDEASQLKPEDALGAILRAKQVVVVGDPKQLPPTNFFNFSSDTSPQDDEDEIDVAEYESILDMALKSFRPARRLKWHYRSKHENLISFSNKSFYDGDLVIFPSPNYEHEDFGLHFRYLENGVYQGRKNLVEAQEIVKYVIDHVEKHPHKSLGIVTINQAQQELVNDLLEMEIKDNVLLQNYLTKHEDSLEPLIIKNLENIQGDERDVILISTVYGKEPGATKFHQRFGPINGKFGHRRLNVLFTRARFKTLVFSSLNPDDIVADETSGLGLRSFKNFLSFARNKKDPTITSTGDVDSEFEYFVKRALEEQGYTVHAQIGVSGYRIDLGIVHPKHPGKYLIGIECDGATYHSSKSARDRDKIRQEILESLGWKIYRIWSTDWFNDSDKEIQKLLLELKKMT